MHLKKIKGLKYPDEFIIKFFFKERLFESAGNVLELGCSNGNNLTLFHNYGWNVQGIDISGEAINWAKGNFKLASRQLKSKNTFDFHASDMVDYLSNNQFKPFDVLLLPSSIYYLKKEKIEELFSLIREKNILKPNGFVFFRIRTTKDYRNKIGKKINEESRLMTTNETNEKNCIITFFTNRSFTRLIDKYFYTKNLKTMNSEVEVPVYEKLILNSDIIIWGRTHNK